MEPMRIAAIYLCDEHILNDRGQMLSSFVTHYLPNTSSFYKKVNQIELLQNKIGGNNPLKNKINFFL